MEKAYKAYLTLVLTEWFNIMIYKNVSVGFAVTNGHETSKYPTQILMSGLYFQFSTKKCIPSKFCTSKTLKFEK